MQMLEGKVQAGQIRNQTRPLHELQSGEGKEAPILVRAL